MADNHNDSALIPTKIPIPVPLSNTFSPVSLQGPFQLPTLLGVFCSLHRTEHAPDTRRLYETVIRRFMHFWQTTHPDLSFNSELMVSWKEDLQITCVPGTNRPMTLKSQQLYLSLIRNFSGWLHAHRYIRFNPMESIRGPKIRPGYKRDSLTTEQVQRVLAVCDDTKPQGIRDKALLYVLLKTGIREISVSRANVGDIRTTPDGWVFDIQGKGRKAKDEIVVLVPEVKTLLDRYLETRGAPHADEPLFLTMGVRQGHRLTTRTIRFLITQALRLASVKTSLTPRITGHSLRHTAATMALDNGAPLTAVRDMLHHASISQTNQYLHTQNRIREGAERLITQY
ncbi:MAG: tyrosine-type recombinase/integrase [Nitrospirales bacterium]|nr:tyrosine-type recombinase/integrase [Nitrospirales bacterium]